MNARCESTFDGPILSRWRSLVFLLVLGAQCTGAIAAGAPSTNEIADVVTVSNEWVVRSWQTEDGLPQNTINDILQTSDGFLWVATDGGLARFDGVRFRSFGLHDGLRSVQVLRLAEDRSGSLWVGTVGGGVGRWINGSFATYGAAEGFSAGNAQAMASDLGGSLWIGTEKGLFRWTNGKFTHLGPEEGLPRVNVRALAQEANGTLWVATPGNGLFVGTNGRFAPVENSASAPKSVYSLLARADGSVWAGFGNGLMWRWHDGSWQSFSTTHKLPNQSFLSMAQSTDGRLWFTAENEGLYCYDGKAFERVPESKVFANTRAHAVFIDRDGSIWVGTTSDGLFRFSRRELQYYETPAARPPVLAEDNAGTIWAGIGPSVGEFRNGSFSRVTNTSHLIYCATSTADGTVWMAGEQALFRIRPDQPVEAFTNAPLKGEAIRALCADGENVWLGTYYSGLIKWDTNSGLVVAPNESFESGITSLAVESADTIWVGSASGLFQWSRGKVRKWNTEGSLLSSHIRTLYREPDGTLWIGTLGGGLVRLKNGRFASITTRQGLINDVVSQITVDHLRHLWIGSNRGIMRLDRAEVDAVLAGTISELQPLVFGRNEGMLKEQCAGRVLKLRDGRLLFPVAGGVAELDPNRLDGFSSVPPTAVIDTVTLNGDQKSVVRFDVPPGKHRVEIGYTAPTLRSGEWLRFRYKLDGLDHAWNNAGTRRMAAYEALNPGNYVFRVEVRNAKGAWSQPGASLAFVVHPHFWQTTWFGVGAGVLLAGLSAAAAFGITASRRRRERREFENARQQSAALLSLNAPGYHGGGRAHGVQGYLRSGS